MPSAINFFFLNVNRQKKNRGKIGGFRSLNVLYVRIQILKNYVKVVWSKNSPEHSSHKRISRNGQGHRKALLFIHSSTDTCLVLL